MQDDDIPATKVQYSINGTIILLGIIFDLFATVSCFVFHGLGGC